MGAFDGYWLPGHLIPMARRERRWTVEYDTGGVITRSMFDLPPVKERKLECHGSKEEAMAAAKGKENVEMLCYEELRYDR